MLKVSNMFMFNTLGHSWDDLVGKRLQHDHGAFYIVQVYAALLSRVSVTNLHKEGFGI
jgi:hypothetical protein